VGHRALHALPTAGGRYDCVRTQWDALAVFEEEFPNLPDSRPVVEGVDAVGVLRTLRAADEALFVHGEETAYLVWSLAVPAGDSSGHRGRRGQVLVPVTDADTARLLDRDVTTARGILGDAVDAGLLTRSMAEDYLRAFFARHPDARRTVWHPADRSSECEGKPPP
jgi:hypothetical protein